MFEKTNPWVVIYWVLKYTGSVVVCCECLQWQCWNAPSQPGGSRHFLPVLQWCGSVCVGPRGEPLPPLPAWATLQGTARVSALTDKGHWNLQKMSKCLRRFQHILFLAVHRAGVSLALQYHLTMTFIELKEFQSGFCTCHVSAWRVPGV